MLPARGILLQFLGGHTIRTAAPLMGNRSCTLSLGEDKDQPAKLALPSEELPPLDLGGNPGAIFSDVQERAYREQFAFLDADVRVHIEGYPLVEMPNPKHCAHTTP